MLEHLNDWYISLLWFLRNLSDLDFDRILAGIDGVGLGLIRHHEKLAK
jgi:hypothetical protein